MTALLTALLATIALFLAAWLVSLARKNAGVADVFWGLGFVLCAWIYFALSEGARSRGLLVASLVSLWGVRLSSHILRRSLGKSEDYRYAEMRDKWGTRFGWASLFTVFLLQAGLVWAISAPLWQAQRSSLPSSLAWLDVAGAGVFLLGFLFEAVGDFQLERFRADPSSRGKVMDRGLWRYTRHPNYFGDAVVWWGLFLIALATPDSWWTVFSPVAMTVLLVKISGAALLEKKLAVSRPGYRDYMARTSAFFPWPPGR